uniref:Uncharacterized protein n=1 Tax=Arundo donax TaxID=35708 RepID=A0A0A8ZZ61_ARUDO
MGVKRIYFRNHNIFSLFHLHNLKFKT